MGYFAFVAMLALAFVGLAIASRRIALLVVLNGIATTQLIGCLLMELGFPGFDIKEFGYVNYSTAAMLGALIAINALALAFPSRIPAPRWRPPQMRLDNPVLLTAFVVLLTMIVDSTIIAQGAPLLEGMSDLSRVEAMHGNGIVNYLRMYILPSIATLAWYNVRFFSTRHRRLQRALILGSLISTGVLMGSKSGVVVEPIGIIMLELLYYFQSHHTILSRLRTLTFALVVTCIVAVYMIVVRYLHSEGELGVSAAAASLGARLFIGQGNVYWKMFSDAGQMHQIAGHVWANIFNFKYLIPLDHRYEFYYAVALRYTNDYFADYWNLVSTFLGEPVMLFGVWGIVPYVFMMAAAIFVLHTSVVRALREDRPYLLTTSIFYCYVLMDYWQMGGFYNLLSLKNAFTAAVLVSTVKLLRLVRVAYGAPTPVALRDAEVT